MPTIHELAERTPPSRLRHVDLLRAVAVVAVVVGHWLMMTVEREADGRLTGFTALGELTWAHPLTWLFQVIPVFFLVGGVSNAIAWTRYRERGGTAGGWLLGRSGRLFPPVTALLLVVAAGAVLAGWAGIAGADVAPAVALVTLPLWFLVVYFGAVALTPPMHALHRRYGLAVPAILLAAVVLGDALRLATGHEVAAAGNSAFAWLAIHQVGFAWQDGTLRLGPRRATALLVGALVALVLLTGPGPYPVSMVSVPGAAIQNPSPPTIALLALAAAQIGLAALVAGPSERWLRRGRRAWTVVIAVNAVALTLFLWHLVAALVGAYALDALGLLPPSDVHSAAWWLGRIAWIAVLALLLVAIVAGVGRIERRRPAGSLEPTGGPGVRSHPVRLALRSTPAVVAGYAAAIVGTLWLISAGQGPHGPFVVPTGALLLVLGGAALLRVGRGGGVLPVASADHPVQGLVTAAHTELGVPVAEQRPDGGARE